MKAELWPSTESKTLLRKVYIGTDCLHTWAESCEAAGGGQNWQRFPTAQGDLYCSVGQQLKGAEWQPMNLLSNIFSR